MYCAYFGFREKPFNITPSPRFLLQDTSNCRIKVNRQEHHNGMSD
jgi:hypothetical protein